MKTLLALTIICLLFCGTTTKAEQGKSQLSQLGDLRQHLDRARTCSLQCVQGAGSVNTSGNWVIRLNINIYLVYSAEHNYLAIYNIKLGIALVYDSVNSILIIVNVKTGDSLLILFGIALFVKGSGAITQFNDETGVYDGFDLCYQIIVSYKVQVRKNTSTTTGGYFSVGILLEYLFNSKGEINFSTVVNARSDLAAQLKAAFGFYFQLVATDLKNGEATVSAGTFILLERLLDLPSSSESEQLNVAIYIFFYVLGTDSIVITADIINNFYSSVIENNIKKLTKLYWLLYNIGILYDNTADAFFAYNNGYFSYWQTTVTINGHVSTILFSRDSRTQNWSINITKPKSNLFILYYFNINSLVFLNFTYSLVIVFPAKGSVFAVYNGTAGVAIAVSKLLGTAKVIETNGNAIATAYFTNLKLAVSLMVTATTQTTIGLFEYKFIFADWLASIYRLGAGYTYKLNVATKAKIDAHFNALIVNFVGISGYNRLYGSINVLLVAFKGLELGYLPSQLVLLVSAICVKINVLFNGSILKQVYYAIQTGVSVSFSISAIFTFIPGGGGSVSSSSLSTIIVDL